MPALKSVTDATFVEEVLLSAGPVLVDFWAPWCRPCRTVTPVLEQFAARNRGKVTVVKLNADENRETTGTYGVRTIPTIMLFRAGREVSAIVGAPSRKILEARLREML